MLLQQVYLSWLQTRLHRFLANTRRARAIQQQALLRKIRRNASSDFGRDFGFCSIRSVSDYRRQVPVLTYEDHHPYMERVLQGETTALFGRGSRVLMFAMTSGTTGEPKRLPITAEFFREYRRGWLMWAAGAYGEHRDLMRKKSLQLTSDWRLCKTPSGAPCGQISGLAATTRPRITQRMFLPPPMAARIHDSAAKHYATLRIALAVRNVGVVITANPSTLVEFARRADNERESLVRDIYDGTLSCHIPAAVRRALAKRISRPDPKRALELERLIEVHGALLPKHAWPKLSLLAVWMGGSVGVFLPQLAELYGDTAVRDHGLSASEGRMSIPLADGTPSGLLDYYHHYFEFIPVEEHESSSPTVLDGHELEVGRDYYIVLTTSGGLYRYDIQDVIRCVGFKGEAPLIEFLNKGKNFSNLTGEKISEYQVIRAVEQGLKSSGMAIDTFTLAPVMEEGVAHYVLLVERHVHNGRTSTLSANVQMCLERLNEEYASKCASGRLGPIEVREVPPGAWAALRKERTSRRGNFEEYKHPCLVGDLSFVERFAGISSDAASRVPGVSLSGMPLGGVAQPTTRI